MGRAFHQLAQLPETAKEFANIAHPVALSQPAKFALMSALICARVAARTRNTWEKTAESGPPDGHCLLIHGSSRAIWLMFRLIAPISATDLFCSLRRRIKECS